MVGESTAEGGPLPGRGFRWKAGSLGWCQRFSRCCWNRLIRLIRPIRLIRLIGRIRLIRLFRLICLIRVIRNRRNRRIRGVV